MTPIPPRRIRSCGHDSRFDNPNRRTLDRFVVIAGDIIELNRHSARPRIALHHRAADAFLDSDRVPDGFQMTGLFRTAVDVARHGMATSATFPARVTRA